MPVVQSKLKDGSTISNNSYYSTLRSPFHLFSYLNNSDYLELFFATLSLIASSANNLFMPTLVGSTLNQSISGAFNLKNKIFLSSISIFGIGAIFGWLRVFCFGHIASKLEIKLKTAFYNSLMRQNVKFIQETPSGTFINRITQDTKYSSEFISDIIPSFYRACNSIIGGSVMLFYISPKLTLLTLSIVPLIGTGAITISKFINVLRKSQQKQNDTLISNAQERISNYSTIKQFAREDLEVKNFEVQLQDLFYYTKEILLSDGFFMGALSLSFYSSLLVILSTGGSLLQSGNLSTGTLASFALYSGMVGLGSSKLSQVIGDYYKVKNSLSRLYEVIDHKIDAYEGTKKLENINGNISFKGVTFKYNENQENILKGISFTIRQGEKIAITGQTGVGKTTIFNLLTRLYDYDSGSITIDDEPINNLDSKWLLQSAIGIVNQDISLFSGTIEDNVRFGKQDATQNEIENAIKLSNSDFVNNLPNKLHTVIGEKGLQLSTGQRQRLSIARAIIKNPPILLLDEATSALDNESEKSVHDALISVMRGRSVLLISHRESTLKFADKILLMKNGIIEAAGTYHQLLKNEEFRKLTNSFH